MTVNAVFSRKAPLAGAFFVVWLFLVSGVIQAACLATNYDDEAELASVADGDTIHLRDGRKIRIIAINTPERARDDRPAEPLAELATQRLEAMFGSNQKVYLVYGQQRKDRYGRTLAHVFNARGKNVAEDLITLGMGFAIAIPPNLAMVNCYFAAEQKARQSGQGIWQHAAYKPVHPDKLNRTGFYVVEGVIDGIGQGKKRIWLDIGRQFAIRIERRYLSDFDSFDVEDMQGKRIRVRGWVSFYNGKFRMSLRHPLMLERLE